MRTPRRNPVRFESYLLNSIGICWRGITNKDVRFQMNILAEMLQEQLNIKDGKKVKQALKKEEEPQSESSELRKFIGLYQERFTYETDLECQNKFNEKEISQIQSVIKKLIERSIDVEEYLSWFFDDYFEDKSVREKYTLGIGLVCAHWVVTKFFQVNRDKIRKRQTVKQEKSSRDVIREYAKELYRKTNHKDIQRWLEEEYKSIISTKELASYIKIFEDKMEESKDG